MSSNLPLNPHQITPDWLTQTLQNAGILQPHIIITKLDTQSIGMNQGLLGNLARLTPHYSSLNTQVPTTLIAKCANANPHIRDMVSHVRTYECEVHFYQDITEPHIPIPKCYYSTINLESNQSILLLEDLSHMRTVDFTIGCTLQDAETVIQHLAKFHAYWWNHPQLTQFSWLDPLSEKAILWQRQYRTWWQTLPQKLKTLLPDYELPASFLDLNKKFGRHLNKLFKHLSQPPITLLHQDIHLNNLFFANKPTDPPFVLLDWQTIRYGRATSDLAYFITSALSPTLRRQSETRLLQTYHQTLQQHGVTGYTLDQCWTDYRQSYLRYLVILTTIIMLLDLSSPETKDMLRIILDRVTTFADDHTPQQFFYS